MNFDWNTEENELKTKLTALFDDDTRAEIASMEKADVSGLRDTLLKQLGKLAETGYLDLAVGPDSREKMLTLAACQEAMAEVSGSLLLAVEASTRLLGGLLSGFGGQAVKDEILSALLAGKCIGSMAISEPGGEAHEGWKTTAGFDGDVCKVTGVKSFVTNGPIADWIAVAGAVQGKPAFFIVEPGQEGLTLGPRIETMGYNGMAVCALELKDVVVPTDRVIGPLENNDALTYLGMMQDLALTAASVGVSHRTMNAANTYARSYHRGKKPIYAHQEVRFKISDMFTLYQSSQLVTYRAAWFYSEGDSEAGVLINCAKVFCAEAAEQIAGMAMQVMAGQGYVTGNPVEVGYREAKYAALSGTTSEVSRMSIADDLLRRFEI